MPALPCPVAQCGGWTNTRRGKWHSIPLQFSLVLDDSRLAKHHRVCNDCWNRHTKPSLPLRGRVRKQRQHRSLDLFAGTGGFSIAAEQTGRFISVYANDVDPSSRVLFDANVSSCSLDCRSIEDVELEDLPADVDLITGGFPCQPYSVEGRRLGALDPRADVFESMLRVVQHCRPRWLLCENVSNLLTMDGGALFDELVQTAQRFLPEWRCKWTVYDTASHTGIPQNRRRLYIVWFRESSDFDRFSFCQPIVPLQPLVSVLQHERDIDTKHYYDHQTTSIARKLVRAVKVPGSVYTRRRRGTVRRNKSGVVPTLTAGMGLGGNNVPLVRDRRGVRKLTPRECFRLQGFADTYTLPTELKESQLYKLAGNAITVPVARLVIQSLIDLDER